MFDDGLLHCSAGQDAQAPVRPPIYHAGRSKGVNVCLSNWIGHFQVSLENVCFRSILASPIYSCWRWCGYYMIERHLSQQRIRSTMTVFHSFAVFFCEDTLRYFALDSVARYCESMERRDMARWLRQLKRNSCAIDTFSEITKKWHTLKVLPSSGQRACTSEGQLCRTLGANFCHFSSPPSPHPEARSSASRERFRSSRPQCRGSTTTFISQGSVTAVYWPFFQQHWGCLFTVAAAIGLSKPVSIDVNCMLLMKCAATHAISSRLQALLWTCRASPASKQVAWFRKKKCCKEVLSWMIIFFSSQVSKKASKWTEFWISELPLVWQRFPHHGIRITSQTLKHHLCWRCQWCNCTSCWWHCGSNRSKPRAQCLVYWIQLAYVGSVNLVSPVDGRFLGLK